MEKSLFKEGNKKIAIQSYRGKNVVPGRELHEKLGIETQYSHWINRMIEYGFKENSDFWAISQKRLTAQGNASEYKNHFLSLDMAKEICMIQRTPIGREFRQYFIEAEKQLRSMETVLINHLLAGLTAGEEVTNIVACWYLRRKFPALSFDKAETFLRILPLYPQLTYGEMARVISVNTAMIQDMAEYVNAQKDAE